MAKVKKTWLLDGGLVKRAQLVCGARTETEMVTRALEDIVFRDEVERAIRRHGPALADWEPVFAKRAGARRKP
jgi:hypothetical protein